MQLEWLDGALPGRVHIHAAGAMSILMENYRGIAEFVPTRVRVKGADGAYTVEGDGLTISELRPGSLIVRGRIARIVFPGGEGA